MSTAPAARLASGTVGAPPLRLGDQLVALGVLSQDQLRIALLEQSSTGKPLGEVLLLLGFATAEVMRDALAQKLGERAISLKGIVADPAALALIPKAVAKRNGLFPVSLVAKDNELIIAIANPNDIVASDQVTAMLGDGLRPSWRLANSGEIQAAIEQYYGHELSIDGILKGHFDGAKNTIWSSSQNSNICSAWSRHRPLDGSLKAVHQGLSIGEIAHQHLCTWIIELKVQSQ